MFPERLQTTIPWPRTAAFAVTLHRRRHQAEGCLPHRRCPALLHMTPASPSGQRLPRQRSAAVCSPLPIPASQNRTLNTGTRVERCTEASLPCCSGPHHSEATTSPLTRCWHQQQRAATSRHSRSVVGATLSNRSPWQGSTYAPTYSSIDIAATIQKRP